MPAAAALSLNRPASSTSPGICSGGSTLEPCTRVRCSPTCRPGLARAMPTASSKAPAPGMIEAQVRMPLDQACSTARLTPPERPKSSDVMISCFMLALVLFAFAHVFEVLLAFLEKLAAFLAEGKQYFEYMRKRKQN